MRYLSLVLLLLVCSCSKPKKEDPFLRQEGQKAHYEETDLPVVLLVSESLKPAFYDSVLKACEKINTYVKSNICLVEAVDKDDWRLNGGLQLGSHTVVFEDMSGGDADGKTWVHYFKKDAGYGPARVFATETIVNSKVAPKFLDVTVEHELGHAVLLLADLYNDKSSIMYYKASQSSGVLPDPTDLSNPGE